MKPVLWMAAACGASAMGVLSLMGLTLSEGDPAATSILAGMAGPLVAASTTWIAVERTFRANRDRLTALFMRGFMIKMLFFGAYVVVALKLLGLPPAPFAVSFACYFVGLHMTEALLFRRLFSSGALAARS